ncbi:MAG: ABC transporter ATP-binding protein [Omnitrophica WOR_2 bacterium]
MNLVSLNSVTFHYEDEKPPALQDIKLEISPGEIILLTGPTGSGKSTLLQVMAGVAPHVTGGTIQGQVEVAGQDVNHSPGSCRGKVGLVFQDPEPQLISLTVEDEVAFGPENLLLPRSEVLDRVDWAIKQCRLEAVRDELVYALSGGQKQRIAIAAGLAMKPDLLLMDGPLTNLDPQGGLEVLSTIKELIASQSTQTVVISSNKIDNLLPLATRILVIDCGKIILDGSPEQILYEHSEELAALGLFIPEVASLWPVLRKHDPESKLPRSVEQAVAQLRDLNPGRNARPDSNAFNGEEVVISAQDIHFGYGSNPVLHGVDLDVQKREFLAIVGQNGSGKSTMMSLVTGLRMPGKGTIQVLGQDTRKRSPQGHVGYVFQYPEHQFCGKTIDEELRFGLSERLRAEELDARVANILALIGMQGKEQESPYSLSVGEKRMLSVATMLVLQPEILILDEPTTGLDRRLTVNLMRILTEFVDRHGMTVIQVSHDMEQIAEFCTRVVVIDAGKAIFSGTPRELFLNSAILKQAKLEPPPICSIAKALFPMETTIPITVQQFMEEVAYAAA